LSDHRINLLEEVPTWSWGPIRPGPKSRDFVVKRNAEILSKYNNGSSLSGIAKEFGLSRQRIHQIVKETV